MLIGRAVQSFSSALVAVERIILMGLIAGIACLVLANVLSRPFGLTIAWADELAIYSMILSAFVGASLMLRARTDPAVKLVHEVFGPRLRRVLFTLTSIVSVAFGIALMALCWRWFAPLQVIAAGFDAATFEGNTFNFIYTETTPVMGLPAFWFFLVMPWFAFTITIHALANLLEDVALADRPTDPARIAGSTLEEGRVAR
mgnify:CR=1 FL=1